MNNYIKENKRTIIEVVLVLVLVLIIGFIYHQEINHQTQLEKAKILTLQQMQDINSLQNLLDVNKQNAEEIKKQFLQAQQNQPVANFTISAPSLPSAVTQVQDRINKNDSTLPPSVLEKTDRTVVTEQPNNPNYQVGVYKINTYKNWEWGIGVGVHDGQTYIPIELQRNYSKDKAISAEIHVSANKKITGGEIKYKVATDKPFIIF